MKRRFFARSIQSIGPAAARGATREKRGREGTARPRRRPPRAVPGRLVVLGPRRGRRGPDPRHPPRRRGGDLREDEPTRATTHERFDPLQRFGTAMRAANSPRDSSSGPSSYCSRPNTPRTWWIRSEHRNDQIHDTRRTTPLSLTWAERRHGAETRTDECRSRRPRR